MYIYIYIIRNDTSLERKEKKQIEIKYINYNIASIEFLKYIRKVKIYKTKQ